VQVNDAISEAAASSPSYVSFNNFKDLAGIISNHRETVSPSSRESAVDLIKFEDVTTTRSNNKDQYQVSLSYLFNNMLDENRLGITKPTTVQSHCIPLALQELDILACAETGSGKVSILYFTFQFRLCFGFYLSL
jgi:hypothetical protein